MKKNIKKTEKIKLNKILIVDDEAKKIITSAEKGRYKYFDYTKEIITNIVNKDIEEVSMNEWFTILQSLFPKYLICSGFIDSFLIFEIENEHRVDPPKYCYFSPCSFLNNDKKAKVNLLAEEVKDLLNKNNIGYHKSWNAKLFNKIDNIKGKTNEN